MRKASRIIYLIAGIVSIVVAVGFLIWGIVCIALPNIPEIEEAMREEIAKNPEIPSNGYEVFKGGMIALGVCLIITACCGGVNSFLAFKAHNDGKPSKALNVLNIVFGVLSCVEVNIAAAIFAFIADGQERRRAALEAPKE